MGILAGIWLMVAALQGMENAPLDEALNQERVDISVLPAAGYGADNGVGVGVLAGVYWRRPGLQPYKYALEGLLYLTNRSVHSHTLYFDWLRVGDLPLRMVIGGLFWATLDDTFCGFGNQVTCSPAVAQRAADALKMPAGSARNDFIDTYYYRRYLYPTGEVKLLWQLNTGEPKWEVTLSWRGSATIAGEIGNLTPYSNNYYAQSFPTGEPGFASVMQLGLMLDARDQEASPTHGYFVDASLRMASHAWGSTWDYQGANVTARVYVPLTAKHDWVWANRLTADLIFGSPPVVEYSQIGCFSTSPGGLQGFGGDDIGRGIRQNRYLGRIRVMDQMEVRYTVGSFDVLAQHLEFTLVGFADAAWVGVDYHDFGGDPRKLIVGEGAGLRVAWDRDFILRVDSAVSQAEDYSWKFYINVDNVF